MKKITKVLLTITLLLSVLSLTGCINGIFAKAPSNNGSWEVVGTKIVDNTSWVDFTIISGNTPCVIYQDVSSTNSQLSSVSKFDGTNWVLVGDKQFISSAWNQSIVANDDGNPVISYLLTNSGSQAVVREWDDDGSPPTWDFVGNEAGITLVNANSPALAYDFTNTLFLVFRDASDDSISVRKHNGSWSNAGTPNFTGNNIGGKTLAASPIGNEMHIAFQYDNTFASPNYQATDIRKFDSINNNWPNVLLGINGMNGIIAFDSNDNLYLAYKEVTTGPAWALKVARINSTPALDPKGTVYSHAFTDMQFVIDKNDNLYAAYLADDTNRVTVKKYNSSSESWSVVGQAAFTGEIPTGAIYKFQLKVADNGTVYVLYNKDNGDTTSSLYCVKYVP